jgi:hypothetical protein
MLLYFAVVGHPAWGTNDDPTMSMRAAGVLLSPEPTADVLFIHVILGGVIKQLNCLLPSLPWYGLTFLVILFSSLTVLNHAIFRLRRDLPAVVLVGVSCMATVLPALWHLQFTVVAGIAALAGMSELLSQAIRRSTGKLESAREFSVALVLLFVGGMTRFHSCALVLILTLPILGVLVLSGLGAVAGMKQKWQHMGLFALTVALGGGGVIALEKANANHYAKDPAWVQWFELNQAKTAFIDYKQIPFNARTKPAFDEVGWTKNDYDMIMTWQYIDPIHFAPEKFRSVVGALANDQVAEVGFPIDHGLRIRYDLTVMARTLNLFPLLMIASLLLVEWRRRSFVYLAILVGTTFGLLLFLYLGLNRAPMRVQFLLWFGLLWLLVMLVAGSSERKMARGRYARFAEVLALVFLSGLLVLGCVDAFGDARRMVQTKHRKYLELQEVLTAWAGRLPDDAIVYCMGTAFPFESQLPLASFDSFRPMKRMVCAGVGNQSPTQRRLITSLGLQTDFYRDLAAKPAVFLVQRADRKRTEREVAILRSFYREKYDMELVASEVPFLPALLHLEMRFRGAEGADQQETHRPR